MSECTCAKVEIGLPGGGEYTRGRPDPSCPEHGFGEELERRRRHIAHIRETTALLDEADKLLEDAGFTVGFTGDPKKRAELLLLKAQSKILRRQL